MSSSSVSSSQQETMNSSVMASSPFVCKSAKVLVIVGDTGSGKTTQRPQDLHEAGYPKRVKDMDSTNPYTQPTNFLDLLSSQCQHNVELGSSEVLVFSTQCTEASRFSEDMAAERRGRRKWSTIDDIVLISAWLNTSKDPVVCNEQKSGAFWKRIAAYFAASPKIAGGEMPEAMSCKQRWQKINDLVCKFCGSYEAATREKTSGQNEEDVLKLAGEIFFSDYKKKFNLHHAWQELRSDQKWCESVTSKTDGSSKKRRCEDGAHSESSDAFTKHGEQRSNRPPGVKATKRASGKRTAAERKAVDEMTQLGSLIEKKERLSKLTLLESLIAKKEPLSEYEEGLKKKLIEDMMAN